MRRSGAACAAALAVLLAAAPLARAQEAAEGPQAAAFVAQRLYGEGRFDEARRACLESLRSSPEEVELYVILSYSLLSLGRYADAENYALTGYALRRDPQLSEALGEAAFHLGRNEAALRNFQNYVSAVPEGSRVGSAYYYMGETYLRTASYAHADIAFSAALGFSPGNGRWWARLGYAREKAGEALHALEAYQRALAIDPRLEDALAGRERTQARLR